MLNEPLPTRLTVPRLANAGDRPPLVTVPPLPTCEVCVIVPVQNEAETLPHTLHALTHQVTLDGHPLAHDRYEVIVFANNCTDRSAAIARQFAQWHPGFVLHVAEQTLPPADAYIGRVRQIVMDEAHHRFTTLKRPQGIIASTDGDSQVAADWIAATQYEIQRGSDAVGGRIMSDRAERHQLDAYTRACFLREVGYQFLVAEMEAYLAPNPADPWPRHFQHYGASLAVTSAMYAKAGGMPPVRTPEDLAFYQALQRTGARFRHSPLVRVTTSTRQVGRAPQGLAAQLTRWHQMGQQQHQAMQVLPPEAWAVWFQAQYQLQQLWQGRWQLSRYDTLHIAAIAQTLCLSKRWLTTQLHRANTLGELLELIRYYQHRDGRWAKRWPLIPIDQAIAELRLQVSELRGQVPRSAPPRRSPYPVVRHTVPPAQPTTAA